MNASAYLRIALESFAAGAAGAALVNGAWLLATGDVPSLMTTLLLGQAITSLWSIVQAARFRRKWQAVVASYNLPALGEGIDIPGRPPVDEEGNR